MTISLHSSTADPIGGPGKRAFDFVVALAAIVFLSPLLLAVAAVIRLSDGGPALYRHRRIGRNGQEFGCIKFRTMVPAADQVLARHLATDPSASRQWQANRKLDKDPRITPLGAILRKASVDELPQLFNILKGEMSIVGPRPCAPAGQRRFRQSRACA